MSAASRVLFAALLSLFAASAFGASSATTVDHVRFPSFDVDRDGNPVEIDAILVRAATASVDRVPAVVAMHGCAGMYAAARTRRNELQVRLRTMADLLVEQGYAVLFPDSFRSRGVESVCAQPARTQRIDPSRRRLDAVGALAFLQLRSDIAPDRVALLGWSHGGSTLLATLDDNAPFVQAFRKNNTETPFFRAGIAFYPGCFGSLRNPAGFRSSVPLLLLVGGSDDWTSPAACMRLADRARGSTPAVSIVVYPDTYHGFDGPDAQRPLHLDVPNGVHPGQGVTVAVNPAAREDAYRRTRAFLHATLDAARGPSRELKP